MTIAIGLATRDCVVLAADSAVTHGRRVAQRMSSVGETSDLSNGIEEGALKIVPLGTHAAAAIAGQAHAAVKALAWFLPSIQTKDFVATWKTAMSVRDNLDFVVLVARWHEGPELYRCVGNVAERIRPGSPVVVGSASEADREYFETTTRLFLVRGNRPHMIQLGVCSLLAWRSLNEPGFKDNIGGAPASLMVSAVGTTWMPDTSIYVVDVRPDARGQRQLQDMIHRLSLIGRDRFVAVASTYTNQTRLLLNPMTEDKAADWDVHWKDQVLRIARENAVALVAMVALIDRRIALLDVDLCQSKYIYLRNDRVTFGDEIKAFFLAPPPGLPRGQVYSIPLGEPASLTMIDAGGPVDEYDIELGSWFILTVSLVDKNFDDAERVWQSMLARFPHHPRVLTTGAAAFELEPGGPRLGMVAAAWEAALAVAPQLIEDARFVAAKLADHPDVAARVVEAANRAESLRATDDGFRS